MYLVMFLLLVHVFLPSQTSWNLGLVSKFRSCCFFSWLLLGLVCCAFVLFLIQLFCFLELFFSCFFFQCSFAFSFAFFALLFVACAFCLYFCFLDLLSFLLLLFHLLFVVV